MKTVPPTPVGTITPRAVLADSGLGLTPAPTVYSDPTAPVQEASFGDFGDYVKVVAPQTTRSEASASAPKRLFEPPRAPIQPPQGPDSPGSVFGSPLSGGAGGAVIVFAALVGLLSIVRPRIVSRVALLVETQLAFQRTLSLERPG